MTLEALVFDKDGTLFDFSRTWGHWTDGLIEDLAGGDAGLAQRLSQALGYNRSLGRFSPDSPVITLTTAEVAEVVAPVLGLAQSDGLAALFDARSKTTPQVPAVDLPACLGALKARGLAIGLATNDGEAAARAHLAGAGVIGLFDFIAGYDSGYGAKPGPGQLEAFARATGISPKATAMVGDSLHDINAGRAAGMTTVGVLTGPTSEAVLAPLATVVLPHIGALAGWLDHHCEKPHG